MGALCFAGRDRKAGSPAGCPTAARRLDTANIETSAGHQP
jgi:hypothetical protein